MKLFRNSYFILLLLFAGTLLIRKPLFNRPLSEHHEWLTAHTLVTMQIWEQEGIAHHHFSPVYSYPGAANKNIPALGGVIAKDGTCYYISYPPFGFILPYFVFQLLHLPITAFWLELFNLLLHLLGSLLLFRLLRQLFYKNTTETPWAAYLGVAVYLYAAASLWFLCNVYFLDMLAQFLLIAVVYCWVKVQEKPSAIHISCLLILFFLLCFTEWICVFLGIALLIVSLIPWQSIEKPGINLKTKYQLIGALVLCGLAAFGLTGYLFSQIAGFDAFKEAILAKYISRSGWSNSGTAEGDMTVYSGAALNNILRHYKANYAPVLKWLALLLLGLVVVLYKNKALKNLQFKQQEIQLLILLGLPVLLHHIILFNFTSIHDFSTAKAAPALAFISAFVVVRWVPLLKENRLVLLLVVGVTAYFGFRSVSQYYLMNQPTFATSYYQQVGKAIKQQCPASTVAFLKQQNLYLSSGAPQFMYYSQRNCMGYWNDTIAKNDLHNKLKQSNALIFDVPWNEGKLTDTLSTRSLQ